MKSKKGMSMGIGALASVAITFVVVGIVLSLGSDVNGDFSTDNCAGWYNSTHQNCYTNSTQEVELRTDAFNASVNSQSGVNKFSAKLPLIATVLVTALIIGLIYAYFKLR